MKVTIGMKMKEKITRTGLPASTSQTSLEIGQEMLIVMLRLVDMEVVVINVLITAMVIVMTVPIAAACRKVPTDTEVPASATVCAAGLAVNAAVTK